MVVDVHSLATEIGSVCQSWRELDLATDAELTVDGKLARFWCEPTSVDELSEIVKLAHGHGAAVIPIGGGTRMGLGRPPEAMDVLISTRGLNRVIEYEPADLTVTVEAGLGFSTLQERLNVEGQFLALDPPSSNRATVGGVIASNACGPLRLQYGSARDLVIGTRIVNADGVVTKAGGRVVKNVAGYDLNKLYTGSLGTLGIIVELSFKLHPLPRTRATVVATFDHLDGATDVVRQVMRSPLGPAAMEVLDASAAAAIGLDRAMSPGGCALVVLVSGFEKAVARVGEEIAGLCRGQGRAEVRAYDEAGVRLWESIRQLADASEPGRPLLKLSVPPSRSTEGLARLRAAAIAAGFQPTVVAHAGTGLVYARFDEREWSDADLDGLARLVADVRRFAADREGSLVIESCPTALKERLDVWGEVGPALRLMRALKEQLDPRRTLNPGRFVGGI